MRGSHAKAQLECQVESHPAFLASWRTDLDAFDPVRPPNRGSARSRITRWSWCVSSAPRRCADGWMEEGRNAVRMFHVEHSAKMTCVADASYARTQGAQPRQRPRPQWPRTDIRDRDGSPATGDPHRHSRRQLRIRHPTPRPTALTLTRNRGDANGAGVSRAS